VVNSRLQQNIEAEKKSSEEKLKRELGALKEQLQVNRDCSELFITTLSDHLWVNVIFWYRLTWVVPDKIKRAVKQL